MAEHRILIVEDDKTLRELIAEALREDGHAVETVDDGLAAIDLVGHWRPDLIVVDLALPAMSGEDFSAAVREIDHFKLVPIIVISASRRTEEVAARLGAAAVLRKPFDLYELSDRVREALGKAPDSATRS